LNKKIYVRTSESSTNMEAKTMKRVLIITLEMLILIGLVITPVYAINTDDVIDNNLQKFLENTEIKQESELETYKNLFTTLLYPYVDKAIQYYYSEYMNYPPREDLFSYNFLSIVKTPEHNYSYTIILEVQPFVGPHLSVGLDHITFKIDLGGVTVEKYEHLKNYELPPNYEGIFKKKLPDT